MQLRQIALDTETTGLDPVHGHRVIEIGCVELLDRRITGNDFHIYLNPDRDIDKGALEVHGITREFLQDKPLFHEVFQSFFDYIDGAQLIIHNAAFDLKFLNAEFKRLGKQIKPVEMYCSVTDTLLLARKMHPGQKNNLDALCKRYSIDNSHRALHGALLDAQILARLYLAMTGGQRALFTEDTKNLNDESSTIITNASLDLEYNLQVIKATEQELQAHQARLQQLAKSGNGECLWDKLSD